MTRTKPAVIAHHELWPQLCECEAERAAILHFDGDWSMRQAENLALQLRSRCNDCPKDKADE